MKFTIDKNILLEAFNNVIKALSQKITIPVLNGIVMEITKQELTLLASDSELTIKTRIDSKDIKKVVETSFSKKETDTSNDTNKIDVPKNNNNNDKIINDIDTINNNNIIINKKPIFEIRKDKKEPKGRRKKGKYCRHLVTVNSAALSVYVL